MVRHSIACIALFCGIAAGCTIPGIERTRVQSRGIVDVAGLACDYTSRVHETPTVNGMSRRYDSTITCGGRVFDCGDTSGQACIAMVARALGRA